MKIAILLLSLLCLPAMAQQYACKGTYYQLDAQRKPVHPDPIDGVFIIDPQAQQILVTGNGRTVPYYRDGGTFSNGYGFMVDARIEHNPRISFSYTNFVTHEAVAFGDCVEVGQ